MTVMDLQTKERYEAWKRRKIRRLTAAFILLIAVVVGTFAVMGFLRNREADNDNNIVNGSTDYEEDCGPCDQYLDDNDSVTNTDETKPVMASIASAAEGNFPVFISQYDQEWEKILPPQELLVLSEHDNWLEVYIDGDIRWIDTNFTPSLDEIIEAASSLGDYISFYFHNIETGFRYGFNRDKTYIGASVGKVFYAHFLYKQDEIGNIALTEQERLWVQYTLRTSLDEFSHNLTDHFGVVEYNVWLEEQGISTLQAQYRHFGLPTTLIVEEMAVLMYGIYHYFLTETPNAIEFRENMINNEWPFIVSDNYEVASKTGWLVPQELRHDVAIVEAPSPYILVILTQNTRVTNNHLYYFEMLSHLFEDFNNKWFVIE